MADTLEYPIRMDGDFPKDSLILLGALVDEGINRLTRIRIEFVKDTGTFDPDDLAGTEVTLTVEMPGALKRAFKGYCIAAEYLGVNAGQEHFVAELRPWFWFLSRTHDCRVFQEISVPDLISQILGEYEFSANLEKKLSGRYDPREFILQYRETDLDFLTRIAEEVGIYFYFMEKNGKDMMVVADDTGAHTVIPGNATIPFRPRDDRNRLQLEHIHTWTGKRCAQTTGRYTLNDYNFETPKADLKAAKDLVKGKHDFKSYEVYDFPGKFLDSGAGERLARLRVEAEAIEHHAVTGQGSVPRLRVGHKFTLAEHSRKSENAEYMVTRIRHKLRLNDETATFLAGLDLDGIEAGTTTHAALEAVPASEQYRPRQVTPKPVIPGIQTALVVGPSGEEIYTDKYGRVKIQFHWDREGKKNDTSSCWVRVAQPWAGKQFGWQHIPRIGWEVVLQFEEGDPDRPVITGALYNADNKPPYGLDANKTQTGIKTNSSKGGGGFNELMFEDKKGSELVRFQSERDYEEIVKNNATITVGKEHKDKGDMSLEVHRHLTEKVLTGDHTFKVEKGKQSLFVKVDKDEKIEGKSTLKVTKDVATTIEQGNETRTLDMGNLTTTLKLGNVTVDAKAGKVTITAMQSIELKVMGSSVKIDPKGVTIKGPIIEVTGNGMIKTNAPMTQVQSSGLLILKGSLTMIN